MFPFRSDDKGGAVVDDGNNVWMSCRDGTFLEMGGGMGCKSISFHLGYVFFFISFRFSFAVSFFVCFSVSFSFSFRSDDKGGDFVDDSDDVCYLLKCLDVVS